jgi:membrane-associated phospholipid phosphatase
MINISVMNIKYFIYKIFFITALTFCFNSCLGAVKKDTTILHDNSIATKKREVYKLRPAADIPIITGCAAWSGYLLLTQIYSKGPSTEQQILSLNTNSINPIDRMGIYPYNAYLDKISYYPFYATFPIPLAFYLTGNDMRSDYLKLTFLYLETLSITGLLGTSATYFVNQYRPYVYTSSTSMEQKMIQNAKNSFYAGHVEIVATSTFFTSEIYSAYYPESKIKWLFFGLSGAATAGMGYIRLKAGMHFPSDILLGATTGVLSGILVPYFHNHKIIKNIDLSLIPFGSNSFQGISMIYKFQSYKYD